MRHHARKKRLMMVESLEPRLLLTIFTAANAAQLSDSIAQANTNIGADVIQLVGPSKIMDLLALHDCAVVIHQFAQNTHGREPGQLA